MQPKINLVIIHSFPTNNDILSGLYDFLSKYFNLFPIELPGFSKTKVPLDEINLVSLANNVEEQIKHLNLNEYVISGISFGYLIVNHLHLEKSCKAILSLHPFINTHYLRIPKFKRILGLLISNASIKLNISKFLWSKNLIGKFFVFKDFSIVDKIHTEINSRTFFSCLRIILTVNSTRINDIPQIVLINKNDQQIYGVETINFLKDKIRIIDIIEIDIPHFPQDISENYFQTNISRFKVDQIISILSKL